MLVMALNVFLFGDGFTRLLDFILWISFFINEIYKN